jgi:uncharacterized membrane protein
MSFCSKCGAKIDEGSMICPSCGASLDGSAQHTQTNEQQAKTQHADFSKKVSALNETADTTDQFDAQDIQNNKVMAIFAYIGLFALIPLFAAKESKFARFHTNQGLILLILEVAFSIVYGILRAIILFISWRLYFLVIILGLPGFVFLALAILGIVNVSNGKAKELPVIGKYRILK